MSAQPLEFVVVKGFGTKIAAKMTEERNTKK